MAKQTLAVPDIGGSEGAEVIEVLIAVGDNIEVDQSLIVLESDKASMEIPAEFAGKVIEVLVAEGDVMAEGSPIATLETDSESTKSEADDSDDADKEQETEAGGKAEEPSPAASKEQAAGDDSDNRETGTDEDAAQEDAAQEGEEITVPVPDIGTDEAVDLIEISVAVGDKVAEGDSLVVLESDKASMEIPSPAAGEVLKLLIEEGDTVKQGDPLLVLRAESESKTSGEASSRDHAKDPAKDQAKADPETKADDRDASQDGDKSQGTGKEKDKEHQEEKQKSAGEPSAASRPGGAVYAGPAVRKLARELGVELARVNGSGPHQRILKEDVQGFVHAALTGEGAKATSGAGIPAVPEIDFAAFGEVDVVDRSKLEKLVASNMHRSWLNVPHVSHFDDADITDLESFRQELKAEAEKRGTKLSPLPFVFQACAVALRDNPKFCSSLSANGEQLVHKRYIHIGMAVDTPAGLMVPVIRDVERKNVWQLAEEIAELATKAKERKLKPGEMQGGCFTISSLGGIGGSGFTPIINTPEVGILGVSRSAVKPIWDGSSFQPRTLLPLTLSYDHRVVNGADAGRFCTQLVGLLGDIRKLLL